MKRFFALSITLFLASSLGASTATAGLSLERRCLSQKVNLLGSYAQCILRQRSLLVKRGDEDKYLDNIVKCGSKLDHRFNRLNQRAQKKGVDCSFGDSETDLMRRDWIYDALIGVVDTFPDVE